MTKDDIIVLPNPHLRQKSKTVNKITADIKQIVQGMIDATISWDESREHEAGVALAGVQVDKLYKIVVIRSDFDNKNDNSFKVYINPVIQKQYGEIIEDYEGCLSVPNVYGKVPRYNKVKVKAMDEKGKSVELTATGFLARVFQHEIDHTEGMLFIDRIKDMNEAFYRLNDEGKLVKLDYDNDIKKNPVLW